MHDYQNGYYIGMMSGTSLDAIDAVICQFSPKFTLIATHSQALPDALKADLLQLSQPTFTNTDGLSELDRFGKVSVDYAKLAIECVQKLLAKTNIATSDVIAIGCHGQTVRHRPELGFSLQLLDANYLAEHTKIAVISDFRRRDMAVGGQGAPLVPAFHADMFLHAEQHRVLLNLGGIANITLLPASKSDDVMRHVIGYDTGPANLLLDAWCLKHTGNTYDDAGNWASGGRIHQALLTQLLSHEFFAKSAPKSTGREDFHLGWLEGQLNDLSLTISPVDVQTTLVELTAISASHAILETCTDTGTLFVCGGGAYNRYLLKRLATHLPNWQVTTTQDIGLAPTWVEAVAFAWLARQHELGLAGNLPSVTGANKAVVLGSKVAFY